MSSPTRANRASVEPPRLTVAPRSDSARSPLSSVALVRLPRSGQEILIGRSSQSCDVALSSKNKHVSRVHAKLAYDRSENALLVRCLGWNGLSVMVPVYSSSDDTTPQALAKRGYPIAASQEELFLAKNQSLVVEYVPGITIDVRGERALVDVVDEESNDETEDEIDKGHEGSHSATPFELFHDGDDIAAEGSELGTPATGTEASKESQYPKVDEPPASNLHDKEPKTAESITAEDGSLVKGSSKMDTRPLGSTKVNLEAQASSPTPNDQTAEHSRIAVPPEVEPAKTGVKRPEADGDMEAKNTLGRERQSAPPSSPPVLRSIENDSRARSSSLGPSRKRAREGTPNSTKRARSRRTSEEPEDHVKDEPLDDEQKGQLKHIMTNHLAFSRLSSSPISLIKKSHAALSNVSKPRLRELLGEISAVGVIQRQGKDAAGMPLEEEYYYMPENDDDEDRRIMVEQSRGHSSLRACRRTHKQVSQTRLVCDFLLVKSSH